MSTDLGRVMPVLKGEYDATVAYTRLDIVTNSGSSYVCLVDNTGQPVTDTTYWQTLAIKGGNGNTGDTGPAGADGKAGAPGLNVWMYKYDRGASFKGSWWDDLMPTPPTSNPPKVGDTIIDILGNVYQVTNVVVGGGGGGGTFDYGPVISNIKGPTGPEGDGMIVRDDGNANKGQNWGRDTTPTPDWYLQNAPAQTVKEFKDFAAIGAPALSNGDNPNYAVVETTVPGANSGYGFARQVAWPTTTSGVPITLVRMGISATAWTAWKEVTYW